MAGCHGDELLGEAVEEACPLRKFVKELPERKRHAVNHQEADPRVGRQEVRQQVELGQQLHVVMATHLREVTQMTNQNLWDDIIVTAVSVLLP